MPKSIFTKTNEKVKGVNRNTFDLSFQNNLTMQMGGLYPVFCKEVLPGHSMSIKPVFGLNFMPMYFPVQTRMRANLHFFYVRNRNLWSDWMDFFGKTKENLVSPYMDTKPIGVFNNVCKTGSLGDYLGVPTTLVGDWGTLSIAEAFDMYQLGSNTPYISTIPQGSWLDEAMTYARKTVYQSLISTSTTPQNVNGYWHTVGFSDIEPVIPAGDKFRVVISFPTPGHTASQMAVLPRRSFVCLYTDDDSIITGTLDANASSPTRLVYLVTGDGVHRSYTKVSWNVLQGEYEESFYGSKGEQLVPSMRYEMGVNDGSTVKNITQQTSPYYASLTNVNGIRLSALPFRAYESVYNAFYRDVRNNPYLINGVPEYNRYIPTLSGGADTTEYPLRFRNWEQDFLTTAVQSPQQGTAPLVGITTSGSLGFRDSDGSVYTADISVSEDGDSINGITVSATTDSLSTSRDFIGLAASGISISDFRNVNALQLWLEANNRIGLRYKDQIKAHYDVDIRFDELQMPEFIGGCSEDVSINQINQQTDSADMPLGSYAGQAYCRGTSQNNITHYCDEPGFIIGILSVSPVPNYSQLLPKYFLKSSNLDYFFPEFGHISMQPILYNEVCPVQAWNSSTAPVTALGTTFGYQRAWYEYLASVDEVHGNFRTNLRNFLINRVFQSPPELTPSFLTIDPNQVNDVFSVTENSDKILGQVYFNVSSKAPIPLFGIPKLES